jgi:molybdopterin-containing oxidoreductase family membrane subunit
MAYYSGNLYEWFMQRNRALGPFGWAYWLLMFCNVLTPQLLWSRRIRRSPWILFPISLIINWGMWLERYVIVITSLHRDFLPSSWGLYHGTIWDWATFVGTLGFFLFFFLLFLRFVPMIAGFEMRKLWSETTEQRR